MTRLGFYQVRVVLIDTPLYYTCLTCHCKTHQAAYAQWFGGLLAFTGSFTRSNCKSVSKLEANHGEEGNAWQWMDTRREMAILTGAVCCEVSSSR